MTICSLSNPSILSYNKKQIMSVQQVLPDPYIGEIRIFATPGPVKGWLLCDGSLLPIESNEALFSLIQTTYGGDGLTDFAIPDLQSRVPISVGEGYGLGRYGGEESVTLQVDQLPTHRHTVQSNNMGGLEDATNNFWGNSTNNVYAPAPGTATMNPATLASYGGGDGHENRIPFQAITYYIAIEGQYPSPDGIYIPPPYLAELRIFSFYFAPKGWIPCNGQLLPIHLNIALFSLVGTVYGGDGVVDFAAPNLQARVPMHAGPNMARGLGAGEAEHTLTLNEMPVHTHTALASSDTRNSTSPVNNFWAKLPAGTPYGNTNDNGPMAESALSLEGGGLSHNNMAPYAVLNICMATQGIFPEPGGDSPIPDSKADNYVSEIRMMAGKIVPAAWLPCNGQILSQSAYTSLFSLIIDIYGNTTNTTFVLPDLQARAAVSSGKPQNLTPYATGETGGLATVTLTEKGTPEHTHAPNTVAAGLNNQSDPKSMIWSDPGIRDPPAFYVTTMNNPVNLNRGAIGTQGGGQPHNNLMPFTVFVFCIAFNGTFPTRP
jgi:microcystin-dependent protein